MLAYDFEEDGLLCIIDPRQILRSFFLLRAILFFFFCCCGILCIYQPQDQVVELRILGAPEGGFLHGPGKMQIYFPAGPVQGCIPDCLLHCSGPCCFRPQTA